MDSDETLTRIWEMIKKIWEKEIMPENYEKH